MDRSLVYPGSIPLDSDLLNANRDSMIALGYLAQAVLGTNVVVDGLALRSDCPGVADSHIGPGSITQFSVVDALAYGSLPADTTDPLVKMGINLATTSFTLASPATSGQSINYLIQAAFQESDTNPVVLPYYNAANPAQPYSGPTNSGVAQNTRRIQRVQLQLKAGAPANTGSQATPPVDNGWVGLYVVTVSYGQTAIGAAGIAQLATAPFLNLEASGIAARLCDRGADLSYLRQLHRASRRVSSGSRSVGWRVRDIRLGQQHSERRRFRWRLCAQARHGFDCRSDHPVVVGGGGAAGNIRRRGTSAGGTSSFGTLCQCDGWKLEPTGQRRKPTEWRYARAASVGWRRQLRRLGRPGRHSESRWARRRRADGWLPEQWNVGPDGALSRWWRVRCRYRREQRNIVQRRAGITRPRRRQMVGTANENVCPHSRGSRCRNAEDRRRHHHHVQSCPGLGGRLVGTERSRGLAYLMARASRHLSASPTVVPTPTIAELQAQLTILSAQLEAYPTKDESRLLPRICSPFQAIRQIRKPACPLQPHMSGNPATRGLLYWIRSSRCRAAQRPLAPPPLNWPTKDPTDVLDYQFDITPAVVGNDGDAIATLDVTIEPANPGDLVLNSATTDGSVGDVWLSGGQAGTVYTVTSRDHHGERPHNPIEAFCCPCSICRCLRYHPTH